MFDHTIIYMTVTYQGLELNNCILGLKIWKRRYYIEFGLTCTKSGNQARIEIISTNQMQDKKSNTTGKLDFSRTCSIRSLCIFHSCDRMLRLLWFYFDVLYRVSYLTRLVNLQPLSYPLALKRQTNKQVKTKQNKQNKNACMIKLFWMNFSSKCVRSLLRSVLCII